MIEIKILKIISQLALLVSLKWLIVFVFPWLFLRCWTLLGRISVFASIGTDLTQRAVITAEDNFYLLTWHVGNIHSLCGKNILFTHDETVGNMTVIKICFSHRMHEIRYLYIIWILNLSKKKKKGEKEFLQSLTENHQIKKIVVKDVLYAQRFLTSIRSGEIE